MPREPLFPHRPKRREPLYPSRSKGGLTPRVIPTELRRPPPTDRIEFLPDSPEFLTYTVANTGYREKLDNAFQEAIKRAKNLK